MNFRLRHTAILALAGLFFFACQDKEPNPIRVEKQAKDKQAIQNLCETDADCHVTGCHRTLCRATLEEDFCEHRLVIQADPDDIDVLEMIADQILTIREGQSLRIGGASTQRMTVAFHADLSQRQRMIDAFSAIAYTGLFRVPEDVTYRTISLYNEIKNSVPDLTLHKTQLIGPLIEKNIRSGDILSKDDISKTWAQIGPLLSTQNSTLWAYDIIHQARPQMRLWPLDKEQFIPLTDLKSLKIRRENGEIRISAQLNEPASARLADWTQKETMVLLAIGREIIAPAIVRNNIDSGKFEFVIKEQLAKNIPFTTTNMLERLQTLKLPMKYDEADTEKVEKDLTCNRKIARNCACVAGSCQWENSEAYQTCMQTP